jgi:hypothetical protein
MSNCYNCQYRGNLPGSAHSSCNGLRSLANDPNDAGLVLLETKLSLGMVSMKIGNDPIVEINPHGRSNGWAMWPLDFDPIWVSDCKIFKEKEE